MSDIERSIRAWRESLLAREGVRAEHADELEDHLREEIETLRASNLSEEEIFRVAEVRLGRVEVIAAELERADPIAVWRRRWIWMVCGYLALGAALRLIATAEHAAQWLARSHSSATVVAASTAALALGVALVILIARWMSRAVSTPDGSRWVRSLATTRGIAGLLLLGCAMLALVQYGTWLLYMQLDWAPQGTRIQSGASAWILALSRLLVPVIALCVLLWIEARRSARQATGPDDRAVWRNRWIWMLIGYVVLYTVAYTIGLAELTTTWFARTTSQGLLWTVEIATFIACAAMVILAARRITAGLSRSADGSRPLTSAGSIFAIGLIGTLLQVFFVTAPALLVRNFEWQQGDAHLEMSTSLGWAWGMLTQFVPVAALCALLWIESRRKRGATASTEATS